MTRSSALMMRTIAQTMHCNISLYVSFLYFSFSQIIVSIIKIGIKIINIEETKRRNIMV